MELLPSASENGFYLECVYASYAQYIHCNLSLMKKAHGTPRLEKGLALSFKYEPDSDKTLPDTMP